MLEQVKPQKVSKNGKIELLRFVFCMAVLIFHCEKYVMGEPSLKDGIHISLFCHGSMGVEFFFIVSGLLMARTAYKRQQVTEKLNLATESLNFMKRKIMTVFPMHAIAFVFAFIAYAASQHFGWTQIVMKAVESIPSFFLIQMSGINLCSPNHITWYISCMLIAMALLYPLCVKYYEMFTKYIAPFLAIMILGYCVATTGRLTGVMVWTGIVYKSLLRAIGEIALGACGFELVRQLEECVTRTSQKILIAIGEVIVFIGVMAYMIGTFPSEMEIIETIAIFVLVVLAFSGKGLGSSQFNNRLCYALGKLSLPLYLVQLVPIYIVGEFETDWSNQRKIVAVIISTVMLAGIVMIINMLWHHGKGRKVR